MAFNNKKTKHFLFTIAAEALLHVFFPSLSEAQREKKRERKRDLNHSITLKASA